MSRTYYIIIEYDGNQIHFCCVCTPTALTGNNYYDSVHCVTMPFYGTHSYITLVSGVFTSHSMLLVTHMIMLVARLHLASLG